MAADTRREVRSEASLEPRAARPRSSRALALDRRSGSSSSSSSGSSSSSSSSIGSALAKRNELMNNFDRRAYPIISANIDLTAPVTCQPLNVTWPHVGTPPYTLMVTIEQWTTDIVSLGSGYFDGIAPNDTVLWQYMVPSFPGSDGPTNPNIMVSITDSAGLMSNSSSIIQVSNGTLTCPPSSTYIDFYIVIPEGATPSQCRPWSLSWQRIDASPQSLVPPLAIFLLQSSEPPITIRIPNSVAAVRGNGSGVDGTYSFVLPVRGQKRFLTTMSDHGPLGSGGVLGLTTPASDESNSEDCLFPEAMDRYPRELPSATRTLSARPTITPIINGSANGIPILVTQGTITTTGYAAYGNADSGAQTIYEDGGLYQDGDGIGGPLGTGGLIGVVLGAGFVAGALLATLAWLFIRSRRRERQLRYRMEQAEAKHFHSGGAGAHHHGGDGGYGNGNGLDSSDASTTAGRNSSHLQHRLHASGNGRAGGAPGGSPIEMRQTFSDSGLRTEEIDESSPGGGGGGAHRRRQTTNGVALTGERAAPRKAAGLGGLLARLRLPGAHGADHQDQTQGRHDTDSFHSLHPLEPGLQSHASTLSMRATPGGVAGAASHRSGPGSRAGDGSPASPLSPHGSHLPFHERAGGPNSPTDPPGSSSWAASSSYNSSRRPGTSTVGTASRAPRGQGAAPNVVQHADAGLLMDDNVYDDEDVGAGPMVELPPQYDSIEVRVASPAHGPASASGGAGAGAGSGSRSALNSAGPAGAGASYSASASGGSAPGAAGGRSDSAGGWYPASPTSGSGNGYGSGTGTGESSDLLMAQAGRTDSGMGMRGERGLDGAAGSTSVGSSAFANAAGRSSSPLAGASSAGGAASPRPDTAGVATGAAGTAATGSAAAGPSSSNGEKKPKLKLATPATAAASGLLEDLLRGHGAGPQYSVAQGEDGAPVAHNHAIDVVEAEPEEWETIPPEVLRRRGVRRRVVPGGGNQGAGSAGGTVGGTASLGTAGTGSGSGFGSGFGSGSGSGAAGASSAGSGTGTRGSTGGAGAGAQVEEVYDDDEQIPDESEFWIVPRG